MEEHICKCGRHAVHIPNQSYQYSARLFLGAFLVRVLICMYRDWIRSTCSREISYHTVDLPLSLPVTRIDMQRCDKAMSHTDQGRLG